MGEERMIQVYVRDDIDDHGVLLGEFCLEDLNELNRSLQTHGVYMWGRGYRCKYVFSQFVIYDASMVFEIVVTKTE